MADPDLVDAALRAWNEHLFADTTTCVCGYGPHTAPDWDRHRMDAALDAVSERIPGRGTQR